MESREPMAAKQSNMKIVAIVVLTLALLGAVGYIVYDKFFIADEAAPAKSNEANQIKDNPRQVAEKELCAPHEKMCIKYPETWTAKIEEEASTLAPVQTDRITLESGDGVKVSLNSGVMGVGSVCMPETAGKLTVARQSETKLSGYSTEHGGKPTVSVAAIVISNQEGTEFTPMIGLTNSAELIDGTSDSACAAGIFGLIEGKIKFVGEGMPESFGGVSLKTGGSFGASSPEKSYPSLEEAKKVLESPSYKQAFDIIASAYYK